MHKKATPDQFLAGTLPAKTAPVSPPIILRPDDRVVTMFLG